MRPGERVSTTTRSDRNTASSTLWVTNSTVLRSRSQISSSSFCSRCGRAHRARRTARPSAGCSGHRPACGRSPPVASCRRTAPWGRNSHSPSRCTSAISARAPWPRPRSRHALLDQPVHDVAEHGLPGKQRELLEHRPAVGPRPGDRLSRYRNASCRRPHEPADDVEERGLAAARRSQDRYELALRHVERDVGQRQMRRATLRLERLASVPRWRSLGTVSCPPLPACGERENSYSIGATMLGWRNWAASSLRAIMPVSA